MSQTLFFFHYKPIRDRLEANDELATARKVSALALVGSYNHLLPRTPLPSDPAVAAKPAARATSTVAWGLAMNQNCSMRGAKGGEEVVRRFVE